MTKYIAIAAIVLMFVSSCENQSPESRFWIWFEENQDEIYHFERDQERTFDKLQEALSKVHPDLTFEFGPVEDGKREFVISADGIIEAFPAVEALHSSAPSLPRWTIIKFRPRRPAMEIRLGDLKLEPTDIGVSIEADGSKAGLTVFLKDFDQSRTDQYRQAVFIMLDQAIGEYDMETKVGFIELQPFEINSEFERYSLDELPRRFDDFLKR